MLTDEANRPALIVALTSHALMMGLMAVAECLVPLASGGAFIVMAICFLYFATFIAGIAWVAEIPIIRSFNGSQSSAKQAVGCTLFLVGVVVITLALIATGTQVTVWSYAVLAGIEGFGAVSQFRQSARDNASVSSIPLPAARLVR